MVEAMDVSTYDVKNPPMMGCGHAANATYNSPDGDLPCCVICAGIVPGAYEVVDKPDLTGRKARCSYSSGGPHSARPNSGPIYPNRTALDGPVDSAWGLPFFSYHPDKQYDEFYCGCWGWD